jgi:hypothetical protein
LGAAPVGAVPPSPQTLKKGFEPMALWSIDSSQDHDVYTVVYLLRDALQSALNDALFLERTSLPKVEVKGAGHAEIAARLGRFRDGCATFKEREALMLTKLLRARAWTLELRKLVPDFQSELDAFLEATAPCGEMCSGFMKDAQSIFHGGGSLVRFLAARKPRSAPKSADEALPDQPYLVGGRTALVELRTVCEGFLAQIEDEFFTRAKLSEQEVRTPVLGLLPAPDDLAPATGDALH